MTTIQIDPKESSNKKILVKLIEPNNQQLSWRYGSDLNIPKNNHYQNH
jgi:hypothetical protein